VEGPEKWSARRPRWLSAGLLILIAQLSRFLDDFQSLKTRQFVFIL